MDARAYFDIEGVSLTAFQLSFLAALRRKIGKHLRPYCAEASQDSLLVVLDITSPGTVLVSAGLELRGNKLRGDRVRVQDWSFPPVPTPQCGFIIEGPIDVLAAQGCKFLEKFASRPIVEHQWLHKGRVYAQCHVFDDSGERLSQMYRADWAPAGQAGQLIEDGFVHGKGWIQTEGLGPPDRVARVPRP